ncbi:MAG: PEP-CTERM sorting domain-containing protein [Candidatus Nanoarchaeia archaeon]|nr:PEP-CTERM sorting domain-containing protein [Candidatus Nanoarchaeia archaeon]MDD5740563.1 PEP-CTERM sorting domain-containing protein [Candidatus Nanoarchaeia archaeon]
MGFKKTLASLVLAGALAIGGLCSKAKCDNYDFAPPSYRGQPQSAQFIWDFTSQPDIIHNTSPFGTVNYVSAVKSSVGSLAGNGTMRWNDNSFYWDTNSNKFTKLYDPVLQSPEVCGLTLAMPNFNNMPKKEMRIQITYGNALDSNSPLPNPSFSNPSIPSIPGWPPPEGTIHVPEGYARIDSNHFYQDLAFYPSPEREMFNIGFKNSAYIDKIIIDTISIPEPSTIGLLGLGSLALVKKRKK